MMEHSQNSGFYLESADTSFSSPLAIDNLSYKALVANTKQALSIGLSNIQKDCFTKLLENWSTCIYQSLDLITALLSDTEFCLNSLTDYLTNAVSLLQSLSDLIKTCMDSVSMCCSAYKTIPTVVGQIIVMVFTHCRDSESLYGNRLGSVEAELKGLFRNCHELQLNYLMLLEKHFVFDLTQTEEKDILIEALNINLKIGEIVQSLDVKSMAEQWKAYTMICEKYSANLRDTSIFQDCTQILCSLVKNNIKTAVETNQDDKVVLRSLKVSSFTIKILLKTCNIFKHGTRKDYANVIELLIYIQINCSTNLETTSEKSPQFMNLMNTNVELPSECLIKELLSDEMFANSLLNCDVEKNASEGNILGFLLTIISAIKCLLQGNTNSKISKSKLINCIYSILPHCYVWFNQNMKFKSESHGLFDLLTHTAALACTLNNEEFHVLEKNMIETILNTDCSSAFFSVNIWVMMASRVTPQLLFNQLIWLCTMYKKLEKHKMFDRSPQKVHLSYTISMLFQVMGKEDKIKICKQFRIHDVDNISLWTALNVNNLPEELQCAAEEVVAEKLKTQFQECFTCNKGGEEFKALIKIINLAATCSFKNGRGLENCLLKGWLKACPRHYFMAHHLDISTFWFFDYLQAIAALTDTLWHIICERNSYLIEMLHVVNSLIKKGNNELKLILLDTLCKIASSNSLDRTHTVDVTDTFTSLFLDSDDVVQNKLVDTLLKYKENKNIDRLMSNIANQDSSVQETWSNIKDGRIPSYSKDELLKAADFSYSHKCLEAKNIIIQSSGSSPVSVMKSCSSNFDFVEIDDLFENESDSEEPMCKKVKLNSDEADLIIKRLETDTSLLCKVKENVFTPEYKNRILTVCDNLRNIAH